MLNSIRKKMLVFILIPVVGIDAMTAAWNIFKTQQWNIREARRHMTILVENQAGQFGSQLREIAQIASSTASFLESAPDLTEENLYAQLKKNVSRYPLV